MRRSLIADVSVGLLFHSILVLAVFFLFAGHNQPGGGFAGGLVAGAGIALRYVTGGAEAVRTTIRLRAWFVLGLGLCVAATTAIVPLVLGQDVLEHAVFEEDLPLLGVVKATSALPFDVGVFLVVVGVVSMAFEGFGRDDPAAVADMVEGSADAHAEPLGPRGSTS